MRMSLCRTAAASFCVMAFLWPCAAPADVDHDVFINADLKAADSSGQPLAEVKLKSNEVVRWTNQSGRLVVITVAPEKGPRAGMVHKVLAGAPSLRLQPGESVVRRTGTLRRGIKYLTHFGWRATESRAITGSGGGPDIVIPPPPPTP